MSLERLTLKNFRNISDLNLDFHPEFNFIFGHNAQGKTNLIEAVYYLSTLKSFRTTDRKELIRKSESTAKITGVVTREGLGWDLDITLTADSRHLLVNGKRPSSRADYHALVPLILFEPRHIYLFRDSPSERRRYLNRALFLQDPGFLAIAQNYEKSLTQKNRLLKERGDTSLIDLWNEKLAVLGGEMITARRRWFSAIREALAHEYTALSGTREDLALTYLPSEGLLNEIPDSELTSEMAISALRERLHARLRDECERRESFIGPHRDDFRASLDGREIGSFGSQGENRSAVIALKLAQLKNFTALHGKTPLFLLDDVASELDENRCRHLFTYLRDTTTQVFLTTPSNNLIHEEFHGHSRSFLVEHGQVSVLA